MRTTPLSVAIAAAIAVPSAARADVRVGLGAAAGAEAQGLSADVDLGPAIVEATVDSMSWSDQTFGSGRATTATIGALARVAHDGKVSLYTGLRLERLWFDPPSNGPYSGPELGVPVRIQLDVTSWLSIDAEDDLEVSHSGGKHGVELDAPMLGFTVWF